MSNRSAPAIPNRDDGPPASCRSEAVLRILKNRSTVSEEAARYNVDANAVTQWLMTAVHAICARLERSRVDG